VLLAPLDELPKTRRRMVASWSWTAVAVLSAWLAAGPRLVPSSAGDHGTFVSVAERLRAGDRLYADVWDNKDPLFYYLLALARSVSEHGDLLLEAAWLVVACTACHRLAHVIGLPGRQCVVVAWAAVPLLLTGSAYTAGLTHLPAIALSLCVLAAGLDRRWVLAGTCLSLVVLLKLVLVPLALLLLVLAWWRDRRLAAALRVAVGVTLVLAPASAVMAARGELDGYLNMLLSNVDYAQGDGLVTSRWGSTVGHLLRVAPEDGTGGTVTTAAGILLVLLIVGIGSGEKDARLLHRAAATTLGLAVLTLAATGLWPGHAQVLYVPGVLVTLALAAHLARHVGGTSLRATAILVLAAFVIGGAPHPVAYVDSIRTVGRSMRSLEGPSEPARALLETATTGRYARLGSNDLEAHARGLGAWQLACPRFHQYPFDPPTTFDDTVDCLHRADAVIVSRSFVPLDGHEHWNLFVQRARTELDRDFRCRATHFGELCTKK
jgi:hypothetical protein